MVQTPEHGKEFLSDNAPGKAPYGKKKFISTIECSAQPTPKQVSIRLLSEEIVPTGSSRFGGAAFMQLK
ncbi:MAG TPA: hypothetical protein VH643_06020 [Gemmataceae bacterium]|jgi:hypothetical protein